MLCRYTLAWVTKCMMFTKKESSSAEGGGGGAAEGTPV
jgi:hypothetical protein